MLGGNLLLRSGSNAISPDSVAGLLGWFTAYDNTYLESASNGTGGTVNNGEGVGRWVSRGGSGISHIVSNGTPKPTYLTGKGLNTWWKTDGGTSQSAFTRSGLSGVGTTQSFSYVALLWTSGAKAGAMVDLNSTAIGLLNGLISGASPARNAYAFINASLTSPPSGAIGRKTARYLTIGLSASASGINIWLNETKYTINTPATLANITALYLGTSAGGNPIPHRFYEVAFFNSALDDTTMTGLLAHLRAQTVTPSAVNQVCVIGDSMSQGVGSETGQPYHWQLSNKSEYQWHTYAIDGGYLFSSTPITASTLNTFKLAGDNIAIVWLGTNDINAVNRTEAQFISDLTTYCSTLKTNGWKVIVCTLQDFPNNEATRLAVNTSIRTNFATYATAIADLGDDARLSDCTNTTYFTSDQVHLKDAGHQVVASIIDSVLASV